MPPVLQIGATVDVQEVRAGMDAGVEAVKASTSKMALNFDELASVSQRSFARISESTKETASTIGAEWVKAAESTAVFNRAQAEVRDAMNLVKKSAGEDAAALALLAAAQQKVASASVEMAAAQKKAAEADATAAQEAELAGGGIAGAFRRAYISVAESTLGIREKLSEVGVKMAETAEVAQLEGGVMKGAFSGMGELLGAGLMVGFAAHFLDEVAKMQVELGHLRSQTGMTVQTLAGLRATAQQLGMEFGPIEIGLVRMENAQTKAVEGGKGQIAAFQRLGISIQEIKSMTPDELFFRVAEAIAETKSPSDAAASAIAIFGRGGAALIPMFKDMGSELRDYVDKAGQASKVTDDSVAAAMRWTHETAQLSQQFQAMLVPILSGIVDDVIPAVRTGIEFLAGGFRIVGLSVVFAADQFLALGEGLQKFSTASVKMDFSGMKNAMVDATQNMKANWTLFTEDLMQQGEKQNKAIEAIWSKPLGPKATGAEGEDGPSGGGAKPPKDTRLQDWKAELQAKKDAEDAFHTLSLADEAAFWASKLEIARGTPKLFAEVNHQISEAERKEKQDDLKETADSVRNRVAAEKSGSSERLIIIRDFLAQMKSMGAEQTTEYKQFSRMEVEETRANEEQKKRAVLDAELAKAAATKNGTAEHVRILTEALEVAKRLYKQDSSEYEKVLKDKNRAELEFAQKTKEAQDIEREADKNHQVAMLNQEKQRIEAEAQAGLISTQQKLSALKVLEEQEYNLQANFLKRKLDLAKLDPTMSPDALARIQAQILALEDGFHQKELQLDIQSGQQRMKVFQQYSQTIKSGFDSAIQGMIQGTQTFGKGLQQMFSSMVVQFAQHMAQMLLKFIATKAAEVVAHKAADTIMTASTVTASADQGAAGIAASLKSITRAAATAAAHAFKWVMEEVPFPVNIALAPAAAGAAFAGVLAFQGLATAAKGGLLGSDQLVLAHENEMILPSYLSAGLQSIIGMGSMNNPRLMPAMAGAPGVTNNAGSEFHYHDNRSHSALDGSGMEGVLSRHSDALAKHVKRLIKAGKINPKRHL